MPTLQTTKIHDPLLTSILVGLSNTFELHPRVIVRTLRSSLIIIIGFALLNTSLFTVQNLRTPMFTKINGKSYSNMPIDAAKAKLAKDFSTVIMQATLSGKTTSFNATQAGITLNADKTFATLENTVGWQRIPVVGAVSNLFAPATPVYDIDNESLVAKLSYFVTEKVIPAKDASVQIPADTTLEVTIIPSINGSEITLENAAEQVAQSVASGSFTTEISPKVLVAKWSRLDLEKFIPAINAARHTTLTLDGGSQKLELTTNILNPMLRVNYEGETLKMTLDAAALKSYLDQQASTFYAAPIATKTVQQDGNELSRVEGTPGKQLDTEATAAQAVKAFESGVLTVVPALATLTPEVLVTKTYSNTSDGLNRIIEDFAKTHAGAYRVAAVELSGSGNRSAFYKADTQIITASTYKLFVAYGALQKVESGEWTLSTPTAYGTVGECLYKMIHVSDNDCGAVLQEKLGYNAFAAQMKNDGFASTNLLNPTGDKHSTARDEMTLITKLYNHELLNFQSTEYLFGLMKGQIYRKGIPAGSSGAEVADKVGFLYALNHDIGVVYAPKTTYGLVILTDGAGGWTNVKLLAQQIYDFYNQ